MGAISIHAPPRGATAIDLTPEKGFDHFNSRPSARGDGIGADGRPIRTFQFTPLREGRRDGIPRTGEQKHFNSRPSARGDFEQMANAIPYIISIHAPPRGATGGWKRASSSASHFNSRPSARGDMVGVQFWQIGDISIHAPPRGATRY